MRTLKLLSYDSSLLGGATSWTSVIKYFMHEQRYMDEQQNSHARELHRGRKVDSG